MIRMPIIVRTPIVPLRMPILTRRPVVKRKPVIVRIPIGLHQIRMELIEDSVWEIVRYYEKCKTKVTHKIREFAIHRETYKLSRYWDLFIKVYTICTKNDWDCKEYIDAQFYRAKCWEFSKFPFPNHLVGDKAAEYYLKYREDVRERFNLSQKAKIKREQTKSVKAQIIDEVVDSCNLLQGYIESYKKSSNKTPEMKKYESILNHWTFLSPYYLFTVEWKQPLIEGYPDEDIQHKYLNMFKEISKNVKVKNIVETVVKHVESEFKLPVTLSEADYEEQKARSEASIKVTHKPRLHREIEETETMYKSDDVWFDSNTHRRLSDVEVNLRLRREVKAVGSIRNI